MNKCFARRLYDPPPVAVNPQAANDNSCVGFGIFRVRQAGIGN